MWGWTSPGRCCVSLPTRANSWESLIPSTDPNAPFAPDGVVLGGDRDLFVGNLLRKANTGPAGRIKQYDAGDGSFLGDLKVKNNEHHPRGVVFGPDGQLYVSIRDLTKGQGGTRTVSFADTIDALRKRDRDCVSGLLFLSAYPQP